MSSLSRIIRKLGEDELIIWATNLEDRRRQTVVIASAGQQITDDNLVLATKIAGDFQHRLGADPFELLLDLLAWLEQKKTKSDQHLRLLVLNIKNPLNVMFRGLIC